MRISACKFSHHLECHGPIHVQEPINLIIHIHEYSSAIKAVDENNGVWRIAGRCSHNHRKLTDNRQSIYFSLILTVIHKVLEFSIFYLNLWIYLDICINCS